MATDQQRFEQLVTARHPCIAIATAEEDYALRIIRDTAIERGLEMWLWSITTGVRDALIDNAAITADTEHPAAALFHVWRDRTNRGIFVMLDVAGHLKDERTLRMLRETIARLESRHSSIVLIDQRDDLPNSVASIATRFELSLPADAEIDTLVRDTLREINQEARLNVAMTRKGLNTAVKTLRGLTRKQVRQVVIDAVAEDLRFDDADIQPMLAAKRQLLGGPGLLEYVQAPTSLEEIGGLRCLKAWLKRRQNAMSEEACAFGLPAPRGILMLGVQGAGKSLSAKAVATAWQRPLLRMDVGALYDKFIGESERQLREVLKQAERMAPVVLWIDEIEKAFASAAAQSTDGGLSKRMFGSLLTWMQERTEPVFLIATANDIEALPPELLRKGRFDEIFFVDLPEADARRQIFAIHLKKRNRDPGRFDLDALVNASHGFSGAEIEQGIIAALHDAFDAKQELTTEHVLNALKSSPPLSVTMAEKVEALRDWSRGRCVPAD
jgi:AAA+ superfamily predicted ATPase